MMDDSRISNFYFDLVFLYLSWLAFESLFYYKKKLNECTFRTLSMLNKKKCNKSRGQDCIQRRHALPLKEK